MPEAGFFRKRGCSCDPVPAHSPTMPSRTVAIIGSGSAGIVAALSMKREFGEDVDVHVYAQFKSFNMSQGVELTLGPPFQIVMKALGHDVEAVIRESSCESRTKHLHWDHKLEAVLPEGEGGKKTLRFPTARR